MVFLIFRFFDYLDGMVLEGEIGLEPHQDGPDGMIHKDQSTEVECIIVSSMLSLASTQSSCF